MICFPNAKINLGLSITKKRSDGMHNIETCIVPIPLYDILEIQQSNAFSFLQLGTPLSCNPDKNIIVTTWNSLLLHKKNIKPVKVILYKNIPEGSGLGGGSSDAAFFLMAVNSLLSLGLSINELEIAASDLGADCAFFIKNKTTIASGIGNIFTPINNPISKMYLTVVFPNINISTKDAYETVISTDSQQLSTILSDKKLSWQNKLRNDFEKMAIDKFPVLQTIKNTLYAAGAIYVSLTGSGSAIYALSSTQLNSQLFNNKYKVWSTVLG